jgi:hypothetical protein
MIGSNDTSTMRAVETLALRADLREAQRTIANLQRELDAAQRDNEALEAELSSEADAAPLQREREALLLEFQDAQLGWDHEAEADGSRLQLLTAKHPHGGVVVSWPATHRCWLVCGGRIHAGPRLSDGEARAVLAAGRDLEGL